jgi:hypothetical protein
MALGVFMDTWGWAALGHRRDVRHQEVKTYYQELHSQGHQVCTSDFARQLPFSSGVRFFRRLAVSLRASSRRQRKETSLCNGLLRLDLLRPGN